MKILTAIIYYQDLCFNSNMRLNFHQWLQVINKNYKNGKHSNLTMRLNFNNCTCYMKEQKITKEKLKILAEYQKISFLTWILVESFTWNKASMIGVWESVSISTKKIIKNPKKRLNQFTCSMLWFIASQEILTLEHLQDQQNLMNKETFVWWHFQSIVSKTSQYGKFPNFHQNLPHQALKNKFIKF